jgi:hypothetical protein
MEWNGMEWNGMEWSVFVNENVNAPPQQKECWKRFEA